MAGFRGINRNIRLDPSEVKHRPDGCYTDEEIEILCPWRHGGQDAEGCTTMSPIGTGMQKFTSTKSRFFRRPSPISSVIRTPDRCRDELWVNGHTRAMSPCNAIITSRRARVRQGISRRTSQMATFYTRNDVSRLIGIMACCCETHQDLSLRHPVISEAPDRLERILYLRHHGIILYLRHELGRQSRPGIMSTPSHSSIGQMGSSTRDLIRHLQQF